MVPKTERFEMRLDPEILDRVDTWRSTQSDLPSRAEGIRRLMEVGLAVSSGRDFVPSNGEKLMLWMLAELLKAQKGYEEKDTAELIQQAIFGGHYWALQWELTGILHDHVDSRKAVSIVVDTLDMWSFIERAYAGFDIAAKERIEAELGPYSKDPKFIGFDGNNEAEYVGIADFLVKKLGRFESFKGRSMNSHMPTVERMIRMARKFETIRPNLTGRGLGVDEVIELLKRE